jgi:hypothetical protein
MQLVENKDVPIDLVKQNGFLLSMNQRAMHPPKMNLNFVQYDKAIGTKNDRRRPKKSANHEARKRRKLARHCHVSRTAALSMDKLNLRKFLGKRKIDNEQQ